MAKKKTRKVKEPAVSEYKEYVGIIDTMGLDMLTPVTSESLFCAQVRAQANPQRHACMFLATFPMKVDVERGIKELKDPWLMWSFVQAACHELKCRPGDAKTIANIKELANQKKRLTGKAY